MKKIFSHTIVRYGFSGGLAAAIDVGLLYVLTHFVGLYYLMSATIAYVCSFVIRFLLQKYFTFQARTHDKVHVELAGYTLLSVASILVSVLLLKLFVEVFGIYYVVGQIFVTLIVAIVSFFVYRLWIFKKPQVRQSNVVIGKKLLLITQKVDQHDPVLSFMHGWIREFSQHFEKLTVVCLQKGINALPSKVQLFSLGKELQLARFQYLKNLFSIIWHQRNEYDAVLVHMNQEYILLVGWLWKLLGKDIYLWYNHHSGSFLTDLAAAFCTKVFCTSRFSYTAKYKKTVIMPVGINTQIFQPLSNSEGSVEKGTFLPSVLFLARLAPVKKPDLLLRALALLARRNPAFTADFYGDPLPKDQAYAISLANQVRSSGLEKQVRFYRGVPNDQTVALYQSRTVHVNLGSSGMYDKTIFEAMACGSLVLASNKNLEGLIDGRCIFKENDVEDLAKKLEVLLWLEESEKNRLVESLRKVAAQHSLTKLIEKLRQEI